MTLKLSRLIINILTIKRNSSFLTLILLSILFNWLYILNISLLTEIPLEYYKISSTELKDNYTDINWIKVGWNDKLKAFITSAI